MSESDLYLKGLSLAAVLTVGIRVILGGLSLQWLEAGFQFPGQRLKFGQGSENAESEPLDHPAQWPVTRPWPVSCVEMNFHVEVESSETSKVFIRRKKSTVPVDRHMGGLRERVAPSW